MGFAVKLWNGFMLLGIVAALCLIIADDLRGKVTPQAKRELQSSAYFCAVMLCTSIAGWLFDLVSIAMSAFIFLLLGLIMLFRTVQHRRDE